MKKNPTYLAAALGLLLAAGPAQALVQKSHICNVVDVDLQMNGTAAGNRLLVRCDAPAPGAGGQSLIFFAINTSQDPERAKMALSLLTSAKIAGRQVRIVYFSDDTSTTGWGMACNPADCRPIVRIALL